MSIQHKRLLPPTAVLLCFWLLSLSHLENHSLALATHDLLVRCKSVSFKLVLRDGSWIKDTETEQGQFAIWRNKTMLTISPKMISDDRVIVSLRLVGEEYSIQFASSVEIEKGTVYRSTIRGGFPFDLSVERIQDASVTPTPLPTTISTGRSRSGVCCVTCNGFRVCGCAVESECGSCCTGECCDGDSIAVMHP